MIEAMNRQMKTWERMQESARCEQAELIATLLERQRAEREEFELQRRAADREEFQRRVQEDRERGDQARARR